MYVGCWPLLLELLLFHGWLVVWLVGLFVGLLVGWSVDRLLSWLAIIIQDGL